MGYTGEVLSCIYDKNDGYCWYCNKKLAFTNHGTLGERGAWEVDHSVPKSRGGTDYLRNLVPACIDCNRQKGTRMGRSIRARANTLAESGSPSLGDILLGLGVAYAIYRLSTPKQQ